MHEKEEKERVGELRPRCGSPRPSPPGRSRRAARVELQGGLLAVPHLEEAALQAGGESLKRVFTLYLHVQHSGTL